MNNDEGLGILSDPVIGDSNTSIPNYNEADVKLMLEQRRSAVPTPTLAKSPTNGNSILLNGNPIGWGPPVPISTLPKSEPYPIDAMPKVVRAAISEVQAYTQAPFALVANSALAVLATACQAHFNVSRDDHLIGPVSLFFLTLAESGERKTTCDKFFSNVLLSYQDQVAIEREPEIKAHQAALGSWQAKEDGLKQEIKRIQNGKPAKRDENELKRLMDEHHQKYPDRPRIPNIVRKFATKFVA